MAQEQPFHLHSSFRNIGRGLADHPDLDSYGQIAVFEAGARVAPGLTDLGRPLLALHVNRQDAVGIAKADGRNNGELYRMVTCGSVGGRTQELNRKYVGDWSSEEYPYDCQRQKHGKNDSSYNPSKDPYFQG